MEAVRISRTSAQADEWALVLTAAGIAHDVASDGLSWSVLVPAEDRARAEAALGDYDRESMDAAVTRLIASAPEAPPYPWMSGVVVGLLLLGAFAVTGPPGADARWVERGAAAAGRIVSDEPWRALTALTLHADAVHVLGNAVATAVLLPSLVQRLGLGAALCLMLLAGVTGNVFSALAHDPGHVAIGASTATFGTIGALAALRLLPSSTTERQSRGWVVLGATLLLLALLGTARDADVLAHALGLLAGAGLGIVAGVILRAPPPPIAQSVLAMVAVLAVGAAWALAVL